MIRFRLYFDKDKETAWLNEMSGCGWAMNGFFAGFYRFEKCEPRSLRSGDIGSFFASPRRKARSSCTRIPNQ